MPTTMTGTAQPLVLDVPPGYGTIPATFTLEILESYLDTTPTLLDVTVAGATPNANVTFTIAGVEALTTTLDASGDLYPTSVPVSERPAGTYTLVANDGVSTSSATFETGAPEVAPAPEAPDAAPVAVPGSTGVHRWVLQDPAPSGIGSWTFPINPTTNDGPLVSRELAPARTTYAAGAHQITGGAPAVTTWGLHGYIATKADYDHLVAFAELNRRFFLIDHRDRVWKVTVASASLVPRKRQVTDTGAWNDWVHDYDISLNVFSQNWTALP